LLGGDGELAAVVDESAHEAEDAAEGGGHGGSGPGWIGCWGWDGEL
jgi:hypothetical protein